MVRVLFIALAIGVTLYALFDWLLNSKARTPGGISRWIWLAVILLVPVLGPSTWIILNWVNAAEGRMNGSEPRQAKQPPRAPDDDAAFLDDISRRIERQQRQKGREGKKSDPPAGNGQGDETNLEGEPNNDTDGDTDDQD